MTPQAAALTISSPDTDAAPTGIEVGRVGMMLASGQVVRTVSGRCTTPFPAVDVSTPRRATNTLKRGDAWLIGNAHAEAAATGSPCWIPQTGPWSAADKNLAELILFHEPGSTAEGRAEVR